MPFGVGMKLDCSDLVRRLRALDDKIVNKTLKRAVTEAAKPIIAEVQRILLAMPQRPGWQRTGLTAKAIGIVGAKSKRGVAWVKIGARPGFKTNRAGVTKGTRFRKQVQQGTKSQWFDPSKILHFLELGTRAHSLGAGSSLRKGKQTGRMHPGARPYPSLAPAVARMRAVALARARAVIEAELQKGLSA